MAVVALHAILTALLIRAMIKDKEIKNMGV
jgi:hypothetical protein